MWWQQTVALTLALPGGRAEIDHSNGVLGTHPQWWVWWQRFRFDESGRTHALPVTGPEEWRSALAEALDVLADTGAWACHEDTDPEPAGVTLTRLAREWDVPPDPREEVTARAVAREIRARLLATPAAMPEHG